MFHAVRLHGVGAAILWGYRDAATLDWWVVTRPNPKRPREWTLSAKVTRAEPFQLRQTPLLFTAARRGAMGFFCFPVTSVHVSDGRLTATLDAPEY